jgi:hypothetical protein
MSCRQYYCLDEPKFLVVGMQESDITIGMGLPLSKLQPVQSRHVNASGQEPGDHTTVTIKVRQLKMQLWSSWEICAACPTL